MELISTLVAFGILVGLAAVFLLLGDLWARRRRTGQGGFSITLHLLAIFAAIPGSLMVFWAFATHQPDKWHYLLVLVVLVGIPYFVAVGGANPVAYLAVLIYVILRYKGRNKGSTDSPQHPGDRNPES